MFSFETIRNIASKILKVAQQSDNTPLISLVTDLQAQLEHARNESEELRKENKDLKEWKKIDAELELRDNAYWRPSALETRQGPFCTRCWPKDKVLIPLLVRETGHQTCPQCKGEFPTAASQKAHHQMVAQTKRAEQERLRIQRSRSRSPDDF